MAGRRRTYGFSFSWRRAVGISAAKGRLSRKIGIPLTRSGRERKAGRALGPAIIAAFAVGIAVAPKFSSGEQTSATEATPNSQFVEKSTDIPDTPAANAEAPNRDISPPASALAALPTSIMPSTSRPSFNCEKASKRIDRAICADPELARWDWRLGEALNRVYAQLDKNARRRLRDEQRRWIVAREVRCQSSAAMPVNDCLLQETKTRTSALETLSTNASTLARGAPDVKDRQR